MNTNYDDYILQLEDAPPHFHRNVRVLLNRVLQQRWIGRAAKGDNHLTTPFAGSNTMLFLSLGVR